MIQIKTPQDIAKMQEGGKILSETIAKVLENIKPGVLEKDLEKIASFEIEKRNGLPAFKKVKGYNFALCLSTNDVVVHGIPGDYKFRQGDIVGVDCGVFYKGFNTDMSQTVGVGKISNEQKKFLQVGEKALLQAIDEAKEGNRVGHISQKIQEIIEGSGYSVVRVLVGHGIGKSLHEKPEIPGFLQGKIENTPLLKEGMTLAIEIIYNKGKNPVVYGQDNWTIKTKDGQVSGLFEKTVLVTKDGPLILTK